MKCGTLFQEYKALRFQQAKMNGVLPIVMSELSGLEVLSSKLMDEPYAIEALSTAMECVSTVINLLVHLTLTLFSSASLLVQRTLLHNIHERFTVKISTILYNEFHLSVELSIQQLGVLDAKI